MVVAAGKEDQTRPDHEETGKIVGRQEERETGTG